MAPRAAHPNSVFRKFCLPYMRTAKPSRLVLAIFHKDRSHQTTHPFGANKDMGTFSAVENIFLNNCPNDRFFWQKIGLSMGAAQIRAIRKYSVQIPVLPSPYHFAPLYVSCARSTTASETGTSRAASKSK